MDLDRIGQARVVRPHTCFDAPHDVTIDPVLSKAQKELALDAFEQDARQLAVASAEDVAGGEPTGLQDVLAARDALELSPVARAFVALDALARSAAREPGCGQRYADARFRRGN